MPDDARRPDALAIIGRIRRPHGLSGELVVESLTDEPDVHLASGRRVFVGNKDGEPLSTAAPTQLTVEQCIPFKDGFRIRFTEIAGRTAAELWPGRYLLLPLGELRAPDEDEVFLHDLVGLAVSDTRSAALGTVTAYYELPQGVLVEVTHDHGTTLVPWRMEFVKEVDVKEGRLVLDPPVGLFDDGRTGDGTLPPESHGPAPPSPFSSPRS